MSDTPPTKPKRPPQTRTGLTDTGVKKAADKSARTRAREFAL
ncbi:MAG: N utilization substance protein B, partial [Polaromonas sp.]|nr:N utilization substance protein B [Polaromonas sp.]